MQKIVLVFSGGLDSTTLLYKLKADGNDVKCLSFLYGQRHRKELDCAKEVCRRLGVEHRVVDVSAIQPLLEGNALADAKVEMPEGHYTEESMKLTVVPNRNMIMVAIAIGWATSLKYDAVAYAAHGGDHAIYPDCRPEFVRKLDEAAVICDWVPMRVIAPFIYFTKREIVSIGFELNVPFELTWTCYKGGDNPCGVCGSCVEREEAFSGQGRADPLLY